MINQGTYENLSYDLEIAAEQAVYDIGMALVALNKALIKDPNNVSKARAIFQLKVNKIAKDFKAAAVKFANNNMSDAYILGIGSADAELRAAGKKGFATNKIVRGSSLIRNAPPLAPIPEIPGQILLKFKGFESHTQFFGVFRSAAYYSLEDKPFQIMRKADDIFRQIAVQVGEQTFKEGDIITRRQISQKLLDGYAKAGLQSITYKNGAKHSLDTYCEMLGRTMTGRCAVQASLNRFVERGYSLGIISAHFRSCDLCSPYEGTIVSLDGKDNRYPTIWDAETQGLFHANCKHDVSAFFEEFSEPISASLDPAEERLVNEHGYQEAQKLAYKAQEKQRYIERQIRMYKRREAVGLDEVSKQRARTKIKEWQGIQRQHLKNNEFLRRKYEREQIKKAH